VSLFAGSASREQCRHQHQHQHLPDARLCAACRHPLQAKSLHRRRLLEHARSVRRCASTPGQCLTMPWTALSSRTPSRGGNRSRSGTCQQALFRTMQLWPWARESTASLNTSHWQQQAGQEFRPIGDEGHQPISWNCYHKALWVLRHLCTFTGSWCRVSRCACVAYQHLAVPLKAGDSCLRLLNKQLGCTATAPQLGCCLFQLPGHGNQHHM
jgi:hypothetical protein